MAYEIAKANCIFVVVGLIFNQNRQVLITQRPYHTDHGGLWEFPGGKIEVTETPYQALIREIREEVGLTILDAQFLTEISHQYELKKVTLLVYTVAKFQGIATCQESQPNLRWVDLDNLAYYHFPEANQAIIELFQ